jgi:hypothetical protein
MATSISSVSQVSDLVNAIVQKFDSNGDGKLSKDEFGAFLTNLIGGSGAAGRLATAATSSIGSAASTPQARAGKFAGFDMVKMDDEHNKSFKYQIGRILRFYPNTAAGLEQALPEIQKLVPGAKIVGSKGDKIDFGDYDDPKSGRIGVVDVILAAGGPEKGLAWTWQPIDNA